MNLKRKVLAALTAMALAVTAMPIATFAAPEPTAEDIDVIEELDLFDVEEEAEEEETKIETAGIELFAEGSSEKTDDSVASVTDGDSTLYYDTFADALSVANAADGSTITLLGDVEDLTATQTVSGILTLDLNGHTISGNVTASPYSIIDVTGTLTLNDSGSTGTIENSATAASRHGVTVTDNGTININGGTISGSRALYVNAGATANITDSTIIGTNGYALYVYDDSADYNSTANITGGTFTSNTSYAISVKGGEVNIQKGSEIYINGTTYGISCTGSEAKYGPTLTVEEESLLYVSSGDSYDAINLGNRTYGKISISAGYYSTDVTTYCVGTKTCVSNDEDNGYAYKITDVTAETAVATVTSGEEVSYYSSLCNALDAAQSGDTVTLLEDLSGDGVILNTAEKSGITIDLSGHTYTIISAVGSKNSVRNGFQLLKGGTLTIKNGTITADETRVKHLIQNYCSLTLENVTLDGTYKNCELVLSCNNGDTVLTGDTNILTYNSSATAFDVYYWPSGGYSDVSVTIDSNFTGTIDGSIEYGVDADDAANADVSAHATLTIEAGTITGEISMVNLVDDTDYTINISGGTFSSDVSAYIDENSYQTTETDEGDTVYVVKNVGSELEAAADGSGVTVTTAPNKTSTTDNTEESPEPTTTAVPIITGNDVTAAYSEQAAAEVTSILATETDVSIITVNRVDTVTDYGYSETTEKYTLDVEPLIQYTIGYSSTQTEDKVYTKELDLSGSEASITFTIPSAAATAWDGSFGEVQAEHTYGSDVEYLIPMSTTENTITYTTKNGFSEWVLSLASTTSDDSAQSITITYSEYMTDEDGDGTAETVVPGKYNINVKGSGIIYRFMAAQLAFELETDDAIGYEIAPSENVNMTTAEYTDGTDTYTVYEFNMDGTNYSSKDIASGETYTIGTVTFTGVGTGTFGVNGDYSDNMVQAAVYETDGNTVTDNSIVKTYTVGGTATDTTGALNDGAAIAVDLSLATTELTVNVMFPNLVNEQDADYTQMKLEYNNVMLTEAATVEIGSDTADYYGVIDDIPTAGDDWTGYSFTITVPTDYATTLKFTGDGYRTYRTSIVPTDEEAIVTIWNNAMDALTQVTVGCDGDSDATAKVTFLAGDICMNGEIDLYDLSAVVSYFGKTGLTADDTTYIQYDLNRDNKIDSKDIAMVLVSWGK